MRVDPGAIRLLPLGVIDDGERDAVLATPAGVQELALAQDGNREASREPVEAHHRSIADAFKYRGGSVHPGILHAISWGVEGAPPRDPTELRMVGPEPTWATTSSTTELGSE